MIKQLIFLGLLSLIISCQENTHNSTVANPTDYDKYLLSSQRPTFDEATAVKDFWSKRLRPDTSGLGDISPLAGGYEALFSTTGESNYLYSAENLYKKGITLAGNNKDGFERSLAHNYISQHRFSEAYLLLQNSFKGISNKRQTQLMLFDAAMEVGDFESAYLHLNSVKDLTDYNYLIRLSKWSDHRGDLDGAIKFMEQAKDIADSRDSNPLRIWTYSNLADYYGHAGRINDSYKLYIETLKLQPDNAYVKKGIAWIAYASDGNSAEAHRILDSVMLTHHVPDYYLLKAELYNYEGYQAKAEITEHKFVEAIENGGYGDMYNAYLIELYANTHPEKALELAKIEVKNRPTPETYHLLALAQLRNNRPELALEIIKNYVQEKTSEPMALYHSALVYKANNLNEKVMPIKEELKEAAFELGPVMMQQINLL